MNNIVNESVNETTNTNTVRNTNNATNMNNNYDITYNSIRFEQSTVNNNTEDYVNCFYKVYENDEETVLTLKRRTDTDSGTIVSFRMNPSEMNIIIGAEELIDIIRVNDTIIGLLLDTNVLLISFNNFRNILQLNVLNVQGGGAKKKKSAAKKTKSAGKKTKSAGKKKSKKSPKKKIAKKSH